MVAFKPKPEAENGQNSVLLYAQMYKFCLGKKS
jgi:hypothetical protein